MPPLDQALGLAFLPSVYPSIHPSIQSFIYSCYSYQLLALGQDRKCTLSFIHSRIYSVIKQIGTGRHLVGAPRDPEIWGFSELSLGSSKPGVPVGRPSQNNPRMTFLGTDEQVKCCFDAV